MTPFAVTDFISMPWQLSTEYLSAPSTSRTCIAYIAIPLMSFAAVKTAGRWFRSPF